MGDLGLIPGLGRFTVFWPGEFLELYSPWGHKESDLGLIPGLERSPVFWPGEFLGLYSPWGHKESDTTEQLSVSTTGIYR